MDTGRLGRRRLQGFGLLTLATALLVVAACQLFAGIETRTLDPIHSGCTLPGGPGQQIRIANLVPSADVVDVCIRPAGGSWGEPIILNGGTGCPAALGDAGSGAGFAYSQVSVPFTAPAQHIDVKMVAAGGTCSSPALTEHDGLSLAPPAQAPNTQPITTIARIGGNGVPQKIVALPEYDSTNSGAE